VISRKSGSPSPKAPQPLLGLLLSTSVVVFVKMKTSMTLPKYTAEQISEIIDRITTLRIRWLRQVKNQLASRQTRRVLDDYQLSGEPAE